MTPWDHPEIQRQFDWPVVIVATAFTVLLWAIGKWTNR
jgi:hypothetical protein